MRSLLSAALLSAALSLASAQAIAPGAAQDSDHDGISDAVENALLTQFAPRFMVSGNDCSTRPAEFVPLEVKPVVEQENGAIYGQVFPRAGHADQVEVHYYHLWRTDCGEMGHSLDAEHVSVLLGRDETAQWKALYWYAAAHEDTVCDVSQIARAATLHAELRGPEVWISRGKHASFLSAVICADGCGGDDCRAVQPLAIAELINLGELAAPMSGATWVDSPDWPLADKMRRSDFADARIARVDQLSAATIAWAAPDKRPLRATIRTSNSTLRGVATSGRATDTALDLADAKTAKALAGASSSTGNGLSKAVGGVKNALHTTAQKVGGAIGVR